MSRRTRAANTDTHTPADTRRPSSREPRNHRPLPLAVLDGPLDWTDGTVDCWTVGLLDGPLDWTDGTVDCWTAGRMRASGRTEVSITVVVLRDASENMRRECIALFASL